MRLNDYMAACAAGGEHRVVFGTVTCRNASTGPQRVLQRHATGEAKHRIAEGTGLLAPFGERRVIRSRRVIAAVETR